MRLRALRQDLAVIALLLLLAVAFFWPVTLGGKTLLPADNVFVWEPWRSYAAEAGVTIPHNALLSDLYLENYAWKRLIVQALRARELPLWNPYIFAGVPFLAAGQHSALYPFSIVFYILPLHAAYGWFAALHLFLAGALTYALARALSVSRAGSLLAGVTFMFGGFMVIRNVFPMIIAAAVWLPLILLSIERLVRRAAQHPGILSQIPDLALGTVGFGLAFLAGHPEMYYYISLTAAAYAAWGLLRLHRQGCPWRHVGLTAGLLGCMALVGIGLGAAQWLPLLELVRHNFRSAGASFREVLGWAYPARHVIALLMPDFYGNPSHHTYFDLFTWRMVPVTVNALGERIDSVSWGIKNYVEGASYVGTLPLMLAGVAVLRRRGLRWRFWALLALAALLFVFGSPLYYLIYRLPGFNQVRTPFRWIYPYSLAVALLAGMGLDSLRDATGVTLRGWRRWLDKAAIVWLPRLTLWAGLGLLGLLALSLPLREQCAALGERAIQRLALAPQAFADGRMFYSYQFRNLLILALALSAGGAVLAIRRRLPARLWGALLTAVVVAELFIIGRPFFPQVDARLVGYRTPAIAFLQEDASLFRITSYVGGDEKTFNANAGMFHDLADVRGYDSIIPKQYAEYMGLIQEQSELPHNRIAPIFDRSPAALDSPLLDLLGVKYVLTSPERTITNAGYTLVYDAEVRIYRNEGALPRAFLVGQALVVPDAAERAEALKRLDPAHVVILEEPGEFDLGGSLAEPPGRVEEIHYTPNEVTLTVTAERDAYLVLADSYFSGWRAFIRPPDAEDPSLAEQALHIYRANGNFRAVAIPAGRHVVRFKYSPDAVKFGLYISFLAAVMLSLALGLWGWTRRRKQVTEDGTVQRVTKNTVAPILLNLINKIIDMAFAMLMLRILGPADAGQFYLAVVVVGWFDILTNFGLNTLVTRDVAKDRAHANRYLGNTIVLRAGLWGLSVPVLGLFFALRQISSPLTPSTMLAISLFLVGLLPSNIAASYSAVFSAYERMEVPASVTTLTTLLKVTLGTVALVLQTGYVGLAAVSILVNVLTLAVLYYLLRTTLFRPRLEVDWRFQRRMLGDSYPLMINMLLATLFFRVAVLLLELLVRDARVLGWYSTAYKYIDAVGIIPSYFTLAIFPVMARYAATARDSLAKAYLLAIKLLLLAAVPGALVISILSTQLITILGGSQYLPHAAGILRVMIWYMPIGFINSVTQYVLIALNQQRFLTRAFAIGLAFNVICNVLLIQRFGYIAAAYVAIASELALLIPFYIGIRRHLMRIAWGDLIWRQAACVAPMLILFALLPQRWALAGVILGLPLYVIGLRLLRVFDAQEREALGRVVPLARWKGRLAHLVRRSAESD